MIFKLTRVFERWAYWLWDYADRVNQRTERKKR